MKLAITPSNQEFVLMLYNTETGESLGIEADSSVFDYESDDENTPEHLRRPAHRPFGLTWNKEQIFISNRSNLLIYNSQLKLTECIKGVLDVNTHQMTQHKNRIISTMTRKDCVKFINLEDRSSELYHIDRGWVSDAETLERETYHINSLLVKDNLLYIMLHNFGLRTSQILVLNLETKEKERVIETKAIAAHNIYLNGDTIGFNNTGDGSVTIGSQSIIRPSWMGHFLRGMAGDETQIAIGHFGKKYREERSRGASYVCVLENNKFKHHCRIDGIGVINDIRRIDGKDYCHHNEYDFPFTEF